MSVREASMTDIPSIFDVIRCAFEEYSDQLNPPSGAFGETEDALRSLLQTERAAVATDASGLIGCVLYDVKEESVYFHRLAVMPDARGCGISKQLIQYVESQAVVRDLHRVRLAVRVTLPEMRRYYHRLGYRDVELGSHPGFDVPTFHILVKNLDDPVDPMEKYRRRKIIVVPDDPAWPARYEEEAAQLAELFGDELVDIHHIGSTAIVGIHAKPIIDILPVVRNIERVNARNPHFIAAGYDPRGENGIPGRRYFNRSVDGVSESHIHTFAAGHPDVARHVDFCAYLNAHPCEAEQYATIKLEMARRYPHDIGSYIEGKGPFVRDTEAKAKAWRAASGT